MKLLFTLAMSALFSATIVAQPALAQSTPTGSWSDSCRNAYVRGTTFFAECRNNNDSWVRSSIDFTQCENEAVMSQNGSLACEYNNNQNGNDRYGSRQFSTLPPGSWSESCVGARLKNGVLRANCQTGNGYNHTSYNMSQCQSGGL